MIATTYLKREFLMTIDNEQVILSDPEPNWSTQTVLQYYARRYPILATANVSTPVINNDAFQYTFESMIGIKG